MDTDRAIHCAPCEYDDVILDPVKWCTLCEEGLCQDCERVHRKVKTLRDHKLINICDYEEERNVTHANVNPSETAMPSSKQDFIKIIKEMRNQVNTNLDVLESNLLKEIEENSLEYECKLPEKNAMTMFECSSLIERGAHSELIPFVVKPDASYLGVYVGNSRNSAPITGCTLSNSCRRLFVADYYGSGKLTSYDQDFMFLQFMSGSDPPFDVTTIDENRVVVTYGNKCYLEILNIDTNNAEKRIDFKNACWGVSSHKERLYVRAGEDEIIVVDLSGNIHDTIKTEPNSGKYIAVSSDRIYMADTSGKKLHCIDMEGKSIWLSEQIGKLEGIAVGKKGNIFVVDSGGKKLRVVHRDGTATKTVLKPERDPMECPSAVYCDNKRNMIYIGFSSGCVGVYSLI